MKDFSLFIEQPHTQSQRRPMFHFRHYNRNKTLKSTTFAYRRNFSRDTSAVNHFSIQFKCIFQNQIRICRRIITNPNLKKMFLSTEESTPLRLHLYRQRCQSIPVSKPGWFRSTLAIHNSLHPTIWPGINKKMYGKRVHTRHTPESTSDLLYPPGLMLLTFSHPIIHGLLCLKPIPMHLKCLFTRIFSTHINRTP